MKKGMFNLIIILVLLIPCASFAFGKPSGDHTNTHSDTTGQLEPNDDGDATTNEENDYVYFDEVTQQCVPSETDVDTDGDGIKDGCDNCDYVANPDQEYDEDLGTGGVACNGDDSYNPAPAATTPPATTPDENADTTGTGDTSTPRGDFLADDGGSCTLMPSSKMPSAHPIFWIVGMTVAILAIRRRSVA